MTETPTLQALDQAEKERVQQADSSLMRVQGSEAAAVESELVPDVSPYAGASQLNLTETQAQRLMAPVPMEKLGIRPDGLAFLPQVEYRRILLETFGPGNWALVPMSDAKQVAAHGNVVVIAQRFQLRIYGKYVAEAWGEGDYVPSNAKQSKATAAEAARSNALVRCCKDLGIALDLWDKNFTERFQRDYCRQNGGKWELKPNATQATKNP